jgi:hypothetical protein
MADTKKLLKKETRKAIFDKLSGALSEYKGKVSKKKFESNLKKATRLFLGDVIKSIKKDQKAGRKKMAAAKEITTVT